jgi:peptidoglycan/LPS O-acetylase OafA/YrhL
MPERRLAFVDNLRIFLAGLVVLHHAGQPYGPTGGRWPVSHADHAAILGPFFHVNASFFMGLFFLISGYFLPGAVAGKGTRAFLRDRFRRLGVPILVFVLVLFPVLSWAGAPQSGSLGSTWVRSLLVHHEFEFGHLWFVAHLLLYGVLYSLWARWRGTVPQVPERPFPGPGLIVLYILALGLSSAVLRHAYPIDRWAFWGVPLEPAHLPQYLSLFLLGIVAQRHRWFERIPDRRGASCLALGLGAILFRFACTLCHWRCFGRPLVTGFINWMAVFWNLWEAALCTTLCIGLLWGFRRALNHQNAWARRLSDNTYGIYLLHLPILVVCQMGLDRTPLGPLALTGLSALGAWSLSAVISMALRRIPGAIHVL